MMPEWKDGWRAAAPTQRIPGDVMPALRPVLTVGLALLLVGVAGAQPKTKDAILGKWVLSEKPRSEMESKADIKFTLEFMPDGKYTGSVTFAIGGESKTESFEGTYRILTDDKTIETTTKNKGSGKDEMTRLTIKSLSADEMVLADVKGGLELKFKKQK
jgi:uncharacterized protein (TIGR03066 family)